MRFPNLHPLRKTPVLPDLFRGKLVINGTGECSDNELQLLGAALHMVAQVAENDPPLYKSKINIIFVDTPTLEILFDDAAFIGSHFQAIFYPVGLWRQTGYSDSTILFAMIEELCHALWLCDDGPEVQQKVEAVLRIANPDAKYSAFLTKAFVERISAQKRF